MPSVGFGTYELTGDTCTQSVLHAIKAGYRLIDTAAVYRNEEAIREAIRLSGVVRSEIFLVTKLRPHKSCFGEKAYEAACESLVRLGVDYCDLYLIHWPGPPGREKKGSDEERLAYNMSERKKTWQSLERLVFEGKTRFLGVSNYSPSHMSEIIFGGWAKVMPYANQIELHPFLQQREVVSFCRAHDITVIAYSSLAKADERLLKSPSVKEIAGELKVTVPQICLRWALQKNFVVIPKSESAQRRIENFDIQRFLLPQSEMEKIDSLEETEGSFRSAWDPTSIL
jgi:diketogulonate reductase-like aldo/keto reductase